MASHSSSMHRNGAVLSVERGGTLRTQGQKIKKNKLWPRHGPYSTTERRVWSWSRFLAVSLQVMWLINPTVGCHYFPPGLQLHPQHLRGLLPVLLLGEQRHNGCEQFSEDCYPTESQPRPFYAWVQHAGYRATLNTGADELFCWWNLTITSLTVNVTLMPNEIYNFQNVPLAVSSLAMAFRECYHYQLALAANSDPVWHISSLSSMSMACSCRQQYSVYFFTYAQQCGRVNQNRRGQR